MDRPVVQRLLALVRLRGTHHAFRGQLAVEVPRAGLIRMLWTLGHAGCGLEVDVHNGSMRISERAGA